MRNNDTSLSFASTNGSQHPRDSLQGRQSNKHRGWVNNEARLIQHAEAK